MQLDQCQICGRTIEGTAPAVGLPDRGAEGTWIPFVEDLRTDGYLLTHPACFAAERGLPALIAVIHENDRRNRDGFWKMVDELEKVKAQSRGA